ncbi:MAG: hypothetical protein K0M78_11635 [Brevundimonas sp.]|nr:hypothetical protein [Brevundimonas sp.]
MANVVYVTTRTKEGDQLALRAAREKFADRISVSDIVEQAVFHGAPRASDGDANRSLCFRLTPDSYQAFTTGFPGIAPFEKWPSEVPEPTTFGVYPIED